MGSFEVFQYWFVINLVVTAIIAILSLFSLKNLLNRFGLLRESRREYYECGFKPFIQKPVVLSMQFYLVCFFFILYDIELVFSFPLVSLIAEHSLLEVLTFSFLYGTFLLSLIFDFDQNLTDWKL